MLHKEVKILIFHQMYGHEKSCKRKFLCYFQNSGIDPCRVMLQCSFVFLSHRVHRLSVCTQLWLCVFPVSTVLCLLSCTLIKDVDFCLRKARVPDPNSFICSFNVYMEKKKQLKTMKLQESTEGLTEYNEPLFSFFLWLKFNDVRSNLHIYQIRLRINFEKVECFTCEILSGNALHLNNIDVFWLSKKMHSLYLMLFSFHRVN